MDPGYGLVVDVVVMPEIVVLIEFPSENALCNRWADRSGLIILGIYSRNDLMD